MKIHEILHKSGLVEDTWTGTIIVDQAILIQLAELIVNECANIADRAAPYQASDLIKKHFGLEA